MESGAAALSGPLPRAAVVDERRVRRLVVYYVGASTLFLLVSGLLGLLLRESQADLIRLHPNFFYAVMTAHGLGAFIAWAAFAIMGLSLWVLREIGFPMRRAGFALAWTTWWTFVVGTAGIVVTTLAMSFGASWVFLYPLPFHGTGQWDDLATGIFAASVLLVGVGIITWCLAILNTAVGPGLTARSGSLLRRLGCAVGFGYVAPRAFATERRVPYPLIPLTVIGIDMVVATLPLAALLVAMIAQSLDPGIRVDPLLAKNMLWFFGHPVVYLLLFPAVAVYYLLIPRYAGRELVAGRIVALAWFIAVVVNVIVWAHHIYLDYPQGTIQASLNIAMQPLTLTITIPSAISLYSLLATIWRSDFQWTPAAKFLAAGLVSWFVAGLSGIVNATIVFDAVIHNTMWIVGHFHNMALLNIGLVIFAGIYAFLPELTGREWYSERLANTHLWLTFIGGYGMAIPMLVQGLEGAPRRYAVLPSQYDGLTQLTVPFAVITGLAQVVFVYNLVRTLRGERHREPETVMRSVTLTASLAVGAALIVLSAMAADRGRTAGKTPVVPAAAEGEQTFADHCGSCHTLRAAGTTGSVGPNLDQVKPSADEVLAAIRRGGKGSGKMPKDLVQDAQATEVARYVAENAGK